MGKGITYVIVFAGRLCDLFTRGYIKADKLCEFSRHSIPNVFETLMPDVLFDVNRVSSVISGDHYCRFRVSRKNK